MKIQPIDRERPRKSDAGSGVTVVLFDGVCNLCNGFVNWVIDRDPAARFRFASLQSEAGRAVVSRAGLDPVGLSSLVVVRGGRVFTQSSGVLLIGGGLRTPMAPAARALRVIPRVIRDAGYRCVARLRYRVFGKSDACRVPTPELLAHFLDERDPAGALRLAGFGAEPDRGGG